MILFDKIQVGEMRTHARVFRGIHFLTLSDDSCFWIAGNSEGMSY